MLSLALATAVTLVTPADCSGSGLNPLRSAGCRAIAADEAFAGMAELANTNAAFRAYMLPDGLLFRPGPVEARIALDTEAPGSPLRWHPAVALVDAGGDAVVTSGPWSLTGRDGTVYTGYYVTVWERSASEPRIRWDFGNLGPTLPDAAYAQLYAEVLAGGGPVHLTDAELPGLVPAAELATSCMLDGGRTAHPGQDLRTTYADQPGTTPEAGPACQRWTVVSNAQALIVVDSVN